MLALVSGLNAHLYVLHHTRCSTHWLCIMPKCTITQCTSRVAHTPPFSCMMTMHCSTTFEHMTVHVHRTSRGTCQSQCERVDAPSHNACVMHGMYEPCMLAMQYSQCSSVNPYVLHHILRGTHWTQHEHMITPLRVACTWHVTLILTFKRMSACVPLRDVWNTSAIMQMRERTIACRTCDAWHALPLAINECMSVCVPSHTAWNASAIMQMCEHTIAHCICDAWHVLPLRINTHHPYRMHPHVSEHISMYPNVSRTVTHRTCGVLSQRILYPQVCLPHSIQAILLVCGAVTSDLITNQTNT